MSLFKKVTDLARSPSGRRAIRQARERLDTPENRQKLTEVINKGRSRGDTPRDPDQRGTTGR